MFNIPSFREEDVPMPPTTLARERDDDLGLPLRYIAMRPAHAARLYPPLERTPDARPRKRQAPREGG